MKRYAVLILAICLLLSGCANMFDGSYVSTKPHKEQSSQTDTESITASDYDSLCAALKKMVSEGAETGIITVARYDAEKVPKEMNQAARSVINTDPIAAYAVEDIQCELGSSGGQSAIAVKITYIHDRTEIRKIRSVADLEAAKTVIAGELDACATGVVLYLSSFQEVDFAQIVEDYADESPQTVMETPEVSVNIYPETGEERVVELKFTYQTSRDALRTMQGQVGLVFESAALYVSGDAADREKYSQLFSFLMERYDYTLEKSITPSYSLLRHGVGDAKAFATVYAAMCRQAGLSCQTVSGTRGGEPWYWNIICEDGIYYHVDLLTSSQGGSLHIWTDEEMMGYVWDYSAYPACGVLPEAKE